MREKKKRQTAGLIFFGRASRRRSLKSSLFLTQMTASHYTLSDLLIISITIFPAIFWLRVIALPRPGVCSLVTWHTTGGPWWPLSPVSIDRSWKVIWRKTYCLFPFHWIIWREGIRPVFEMEHFWIKGLKSWTHSGFTNCQIKIDITFKFLVFILLVSLP